MAKRNQNRPSEERVGRNNPKKSTVITTGTYKKPETYQQQELEHEDAHKIAQEAKVPPQRDSHPGLTHQADSQLMAEEGEKRSGSDSNAHKHRKSSRLHESKKELNRPQPHHDDDNDFAYDLNPDNLAGENHGPSSLEGYEVSAYDVKELHNRLGDLTDDELKGIMIVPVGSRLEQGAKYIDLQHLEQGEFTATADIVSDEEHYYVPKKETDYVTWNRLNQVATPARLDEAETTSE
ncbi:MAG: hypothetical protein JO183_00940 [Ktedonobacteraceae bacterium]|nr:hypothetical protein [Ktedonobacteraceae bacterium]MBV8821844.1 hypothetical protein [Ktedonobacteraceae bacterium]MBV9021867.1 hypothetical protein [Ktedonobacteraceae bacterium]